MRVLHVTNIAGVSSLLVQGLRTRGVKADLIVRRPHHYGFPHETVIDVPWPLFWLRIVKLSRFYDILHVHSLAYWVSFNIHIFALRASRAKLVIHLHGTELRKSPNIWSAKVALRICNQVLVSTPDLLFLYPKALLLPNPIDPFFQPLKNPQRLGKAVYFRKWYEPEMERTVRVKCDEMGLKLTIPREPIPYDQMPVFLNNFEVFFDQLTIPSLSKTALEALACGCKVISWKGLVANSKEILENHRLEVVAEKLTKIYEDIIR